MISQRLRNRQQGFAAFEIIIVVVIIAVIALAGYLVLGRGKLSGDEMTAAQIAADEQKRMGGSASEATVTGKLPVLQNIAGISFGPYDKATGTSGDFVFSRSAASQAAENANMIFFPFAQKVCQTPGDAASCKVMTEMSMNGLKLGTEIKAAAAGKVVGLQNEGIDSSFATTSSDYPGYSIGYDHVYLPKVKEGDTVKAGQVIGQAAPYGDGRFGRIELFVKKSNAAGQTGTNKVCPFDYLDSKAEAAITPAVKQFFADWNDFAGSKVYVLDNMRRPGCVASHTTE